MPVEGRGLHNNNLSEDTLSVLRDRRNDGNKIRKKSRNISKYKKTRIYFIVSSY